MAQTAKAFAPAEVFAPGNASKHLNADRLLTATPAPYWVWPIKNMFTAYHTRKAVKYQQEGSEILQKAEERNQAFREGPAVALRKEHARVAHDFKMLYENPEQLSPAALRRQKHHARRSRNSIWISSEAFGATRSCRLSVGARDDTGMPSSIATVTTTLSSQEPPPRLTAIEPVVPAQQHSLLRPRIESKDADPSTAINNVIKWQLEQLSIVPEAPEESSAVLTEGYEGEPLCAGPSTATPVAA